MEEENGERLGEKVEEKVEDKPEDKPERTEVKIDNNPDGFDVSKITDNVKKNPWMIVSGVLLIVVIVLLFRGGGITGDVVAEGDVGNNVIDYLNAQTGGGVEYISHESFGDSLYEVMVSYQGDEIPVYMTKDGEYFVQGAVPMTGEVSDTPTQQQQDPVDVPKSDKPEVELFVMTHCPYGTQAEKGMVPVFNLLGDKIDSSIKFVHYFLHDPEETETPVQICIREEQGDKYLDYLSCFLEDGDSGRCLTETNIDKVKLGLCKDNSYDDLYAADSALSEGYGVKGSPTLVINGQIVSSGRSPSAYLEAICGAFNDIPEECNEELNSESPSPGFGYTASAGGSTDAQC